MYGNELHLFLVKVFPLLVLLIDSESNIAAEGTTINIFSFDVFKAEHRTHHLHLSGCATYHATVAALQSTTKTIKMYFNI